MMMMVVVMGSVGMCVIIGVGTTAGRSLCGKQRGLIERVDT